MTSIKYMTSLLTFYLKGEIRTEKNFIQFKTPNTILGLIPLGAKTEKFTIDQISSTTTNFRLRLKYLIFGIFWLLIAVSCLSDSDTLAAGLICLLLGINNIIDAFEINLIVTTTAGKEQLIDFIIFDKSKAEMAEQEIGNHIGRGPSTPAVIKQILTIGLNENRKPLPHIQHCQGKGCPIFTV